MAMPNSDEMQNVLPRARQLLRLHEGVRHKPYRDTVGKITIGVGRNLTDRGLRDREIDALLIADMDEAWDGLTTKLPWVRWRLNTVRQVVLLDMTFNLGISGLLGFCKTLAHIERGEYTAAAAQMLRSKWATQVGERAQRLAQMMRDGTWPMDVPPERARR